MPSYGLSNKNEISTLNLVLRWLMLLLADNDKQLNVIDHERLPLALHHDPINQNVLNALNDDVYVQLNSPIQQHKLKKPYKFFCDHITSSFPFTDFAKPQICAYLKYFCIWYCNQFWF